MKRHFLFVSGLGFPPERVGGAQISTLTTAIWLQGQGHHVSICYPQEFQSNRLQRAFRRLTGRADLRRKHEGIEMRVFERIDRTGFATFLEEVRQHITRCEPDVVIIDAGRTWETAHFLRQFDKLCIFVRDAEGLPDAIHQAGTLPRATVIANSQFIASRIRPLLEGKAPRVFYPAIDRAKYKAPPGIDVEAGKEILFINPTTQKGVELALEVARRLPHLPFCFLESWPLAEPDLRALQAQIAPLKNVRFAHAALDVLAFFAQSRLLLVPSQWEEAWGRVISEAQTWGLPIIARDIGGIPEAVGRGGILMPKEASAEDWTAQIELLYNSPRLRGELRAHGHRHIALLEDSNRALIDFLAHL